MRHFGSSSVRAGVGERADRNTAFSFFLLGEFFFFRRHQRRANKRAMRGDDIPTVF